MKKVRASWIILLYNLDAMWVLARCISMNRYFIMSHKSQYRIRLIMIWGKYARFIDER